MSHVLKEWVALFADSNRDVCQRDALDRKDGRPLARPAQAVRSVGLGGDAEEPLDGARHLWAQVLAALALEHDPETYSSDATVCRVHPHAVGSKKK